MALRYRKDETSAPKVIAKGMEHVAENSRRFAREYGIPLVEDKSPARPLKVPVECVITSDLYRALARDTGVGCVYQKLHKEHGKCHLTGKKQKNT